MQLSEVKELKEVYAAKDATREIANGWTLIAVVPYSNENGPRVTYVLGKGK